MTLESQRKIINFIVVVFAIGAVSVFGAAGYLWAIESPYAPLQLSPSSPVTFGLFLVAMSLVLIVDRWVWPVQRKN